MYWMNNQALPTVRITLLALLITGAPCLYAAKAPAEGDAFPDLQAHGLVGTLPVVKGKVMLVDFWASWCAPCRKAFPELDKLSQAFKSEGLEVIGVSVDDQARKMQSFLKTHPVSFTVVHDQRKSLVSTLQIKAMPTTVLVDRKGRIRHIHSGFHGPKTVDELTRQLKVLLAEDE